MTLFRQLSPRFLPRVALAGPVSGAPPPLLSTGGMALSHSWSSSLALSDLSHLAKSELPHQCSGHMGLKEVTGQSIQRGANQQEVVLQTPGAKLSAHVKVTQSQTG